MVTYYNGKDLTSFGEYLLSEERTERIRNNHEEGDSVPVEERLRSVYHADFLNWKELEEHRREEARAEKLRDKQ